MALSGWTFHVLSPIFTVHWGMQMKQRRPAWRKAQMDINRRLFDVIHQELKAKYGLLNKSAAVRWHAQPLAAKQPPFASKAAARTSIWSFLHPPLFPRPNVCAIDTIAYHPSNLASFKAVSKEHKTCPSCNSWFPRGTERKRRSLDGTSTILLRLLDKGQRIVLGSKEVDWRDLSFRLQTRFVFPIHLIGGTKKKKIEKFCKMNSRLVTDDVAVFPWKLLCSFHSPELMRNSIEDSCVSTTWKRVPSNYLPLEKKEKKKFKLVLLIWVPAARNNNSSAPQLHTFGQYIYRLFSRWLNVITLLPPTPPPLTGCKLYSIIYIVAKQKY